MALDFELSEEQQLVLTSVRKALEPFQARREEILHQVMSEKTFPTDLWEAICSTGLLGCLIPEEYGGTEMGLLAMVIAFEELGRMGFGNALLVTTAMDSTCLVRNASDELKQRILPGVAEGKIKLAFAVTEPDAGSNTFHLKTVAKKDGDHYVLNGQKTFITGFDIAEYCLVVVRTTPVEELEAKGMSKMFGLSLLLVDTKSPGIDIKPIPTRGIFPPS